jgi:large subunit ribosomal protein L25
MGDKINVTLEAREVRGKKVAQLRKAGIVPAVVYGQGFEPILVQSTYGDLDKVVRTAGRHTPVQTTVAGKKKITMIKSVDRDPVKAHIRHVSFHVVKADEIVTAEVPIRLVGMGESIAERAGLVVLQAIEEIEVKALPAALPDVLEVSMSKLETAEDKLMLSDLVLPRGVELADHELDMELVIANVYEPAALQAANDAAGGDTEETNVDAVEIENGTEKASAE